MAHGVGGGNDFGGDKDFAGPGVSSQDAQRGDFGGPDFGDQRGDGSNKNRISRSIATRGLRALSQPPKTKAKKTTQKKSNLRSLKSIFDISEEDIALNGTSLVPGAPNTGDSAQTESEAYTPEKLEEIGKVRGYDTLTGNSRRSIAQARSPFASFVHRLGSFLIPGVDSFLSVDPKTGELVSEDYFDPIGFSVGLAGKGLRGAGSFLVNQAYDQTVTNDLFSPTTYKSTRKISNFKNGTQVTGLGSGSGPSVSGAGKPSIDFGKNDTLAPLPKSIYETATQTLYPQEEEQQPLFGVGVSTGTSAVRSAPTLSNLNLRRAIYRRA